MGDGERRSSSCSSTEFSLMALLRLMLPPSPKLLILLLPLLLRGLGLLNPESPPRLGTPKGASKAQKGGGRRGSERGQERKVVFTEPLNYGGRSKVEEVKGEEDVPRKTAAQRCLRTSVKQEIKRKRKFKVTNGLMHSCVKISDVLNVIKPFQCHAASLHSYLSLLLSEATSLLSASLASLASSSSLCSFLRPAATRCASSSASSS